MQCCIEELKIIQGEKRALVFSIHSKKDEDFIIRDSSVEVIKNGTSIDTPICTISDHEISFMIDSTDYVSGFYNVILTYTVADELMKAKFALEVV